MNELQMYLTEYFGIADTQIKKTSELFENDTLNKGEFFTEAGKYCNKLSFIKSGFVRVYNYHDGKEVTQWISSKGEFLTDLSSLVFNTTSRWNIIALTDCELYTISKSNYELIGKAVPEWEKLEKLFLAKCFLTLESRVFSFLSMSAEERYKDLFERNPAIFNQVQLSYLASMLGMTPETISRIRKNSIS